ncbi:MAG: hypothetical protein K2M96_05285 [Prevotella sp.]|nr:hypothetical protein [Prevotella sp.]
MVLHGAERIGTRCGARSRRLRSASARCKTPAFTRCGASSHPLPTVGNGCRHRISALSRARLRKMKC